MFHTQGGLHMKRIFAMFILASMMYPISLKNTMQIPIIKEISMVSDKELQCLAENIHYEAPAEPYLGKLAVATVTMNRVRHPDFPKTVCGVVYQRNPRGCQFSWTCGPKMKFNQRIYDEAMEIAKNVLTNNVHVVSLKNALYFHNTQVRPNWSFARPVEQIGGHIFYEPNT
jgi:spore germination cell wall hydrolase CwlJ-like protein